MTDRIIQTLDTATLGFCAAGGIADANPALRYFIERDDGARHWFETETQARASQYWPQRPADYQRTEYGGFRP